MRKSSWTLLLAGTSVLLIGVALSGKTSLLGVLVGYWVGFANTVWLHRDTLRCTEVDMELAVRRMRRSFVARLGMVTFFVVLVGRYQPVWLFTLALGIALGMAVSLFLGVKNFLAKRGE